MTAEFASLSLQFPFFRAFFTDKRQMNLIVVQFEVGERC